MLGTLSAARKGVGVRKLTLKIKEAISTFLAGTLLGTGKYMHEV
jgi:hypothetical protein